LITIPKLTAEVSHVEDPISITVNDSHNTATSNALVTTYYTDAIVGDTLRVELGYDDVNHHVFTGYIKSIDLSGPPQIYTITAANELIRAVDFFIVSSNPDEPATWNHVAAEDLVHDIMEMAGINDYTGQASSFTFGINNDVEVNLVSAYDFSKQIADVIAYAIYADVDGHVYFRDRKPYPMGGDSPVATLDDTIMTNLRYAVSDRDLRNRVVVYGSDGVYAEAKAASPYLPAGFYKSVAVIGSFIDDNAIAQMAANYNLAKLNRLTYSCQVTLPGDATINCRDTVLVDKDDYPGLSNEWYVYGCEHNWSQSGFTTNLQLRR
jgi:hypothetical protein